MKYHKIDSVFKRDPDNNFRTFLEGQFSRPEFEFLKDNIWELTEKIDGTNIRIMKRSGTMNVEYGGRTDKATIQQELLDHLHDVFSADAVANALLLDGDEEKYKESDIVIFGEGCGKGIQKHGERYGDKQNVVVFDININGVWLKRCDIIDIASRIPGTKSVPILGYGTLEFIVSITKNALEGAENLRSMFGNFTPEGIVARPSIELKDRIGKRIITKIKVKDFCRD